MCARALWQTRFALVVVAVVVIYISDLSATIVINLETTTTAGATAFVRSRKFDRFNTNPQFHAFSIFALLQLSYHNSVYQILSLVSDHLY